jgi:hypothetical protein
MRLTIEDKPGGAFSSGFFVFFGAGSAKAGLSWSNEKTYYI